MSAEPTEPVPGAPLVSAEPTEPIMDKCRILGRVWDRLTDMPETSRVLGLLTAVGPRMSLEDCAGNEVGTIRFKTYLGAKYVTS